MWVMMVRNALILAMRPRAKARSSILSDCSVLAKQPMIKYQPAAPSAGEDALLSSFEAVISALRSTSCRVRPARLFVLTHAATQSRSRFAHAVLSRLIFSSNTPILAAMFGWPRIALPAPGGPDACDACDAPETVLRPAACVCGAAAEECCRAGWYFLNASFFSSRKLVCGIGAEMSEGDSARTLRGCAVVLVASVGRGSVAPSASDRFRLRPGWRRSPLIDADEASPVARRSFGGLRSSLPGLLPLPRGVDARSLGPASSSSRVPSPSPPSSPVAEFSPRDAFRSLSRSEVPPVSLSTFAYCFFNLALTIKSSLIFLTARQCPFRSAQSDTGAEGPSPLPRYALRGAWAGPTWKPLFRRSGPSDPVLLEEAFALDSFAGRAGTGTPGRENFLGRAIVRRLLAEAAGKNAVM